MSGGNGGDGFSRDRAELFEALGHPTRMRILRLLADSPRSFSELKGALGIDSSGQLQFHQIYQGFETQQFGWSLSLVQPAPCAIQPNSTTVFRAVSGYYSSFSGSIYPGYNSFPYDSGMYIYSYLSNITGRYCIQRSMGYDMNGEAVLSNGIFHVKLLLNGGYGWEDT